MSTAAQRSRIDRAPTPPKEKLLRVTPFAVRSDGVNPDGSVNDGMTLDGYAAVFERETIIDSWEGRFKEVVAKGSMRKSFAERAPKVQFDHGSHPMIGSIPIGSVVSVREDSNPDLAPDGGAHIVARLHDNWLVQPVRDAIESGSINGMSFRFGVVRDEWRTAEGELIRDEQALREALTRTWFEDVPDEELLVRYLREVKVPELGPVVFPAYDETSVGVRSQVTFDVRKLGTDPAQRRELARLVFLADAAERSADADGELPDDTEQPEAPEPEQPAVIHNSQPADTPQATAEIPLPAGEHESSEQRGQRPVDLWAAHVRQTLLELTD